LDQQKISWQPHAEALRISAQREIPVLTKPSRVLVEHNINLTNERCLAIELFESTPPSQITCEAGSSINDDLWLIRNFENSQSELDTLDHAMTELVGVDKTMNKQFGHMPNASLLKLRETSQ